jgi:hypothetical protein
VALTARARALNIIDDTDNFKSSFTADLFDGLSLSERDDLLRMLRHLQEKAKAIREAMK